MTRFRVAALAAALLAPVVALANPHLDRARTALDNLRFEGAYDALDRALSAGDSDVERTVLIYQLLGEVAAALGQAEEAADAFEILLILEPEHQLREGVSPKISDPFEKARSRVDETLQFSCEITSKDPTTIRVVANSNPRDLAAGAFVVVVGGDNREPLDAGSAAITLERGTRATQVGVTDGAGNRIAVRPASECVDDVEVVLTDATPPVDDQGSILGHWALWGGAAVAFSAAGAYFGLQTRSDVDVLRDIYTNSAQHEYSEAVKIEDSAHRNALFANIGFAAAGGAAVVAGVLLLRADEDPPASSTVVVAPIATPDRLGVTFAMPF